MSLIRTALDMAKRKQEASTSAKTFRASQIVDGVPHTYIFRQDPQTGEAIPIQDLGPVDTPPTPDEIDKRDDAARMRTLQEQKLTAEIAESKSLTSKTEKEIALLKAQRDKKRLERPLSTISQSDRRSLVDAGLRKLGTRLGLDGVSIANIMNQNIPFPAMAAMLDEAGYGGLASEMLEESNKLYADQSLTDIINEMIDKAKPLPQEALQSPQPVKPKYDFNDFMPKK